mgnify:CR=1 FL=1|tara:strand:- start:165 stop:491 length:327 start_codon:yes stop_codon:yes gene_type:complete
MATTYTWEFSQLDTAPSEGSLSDVVKSIHWRIIGESDANNNTSIYGQTHIGAADADSFTAFNSLTEAWCKTKVLASLDRTEVELKSSLDSQLLLLDTPTLVGRLPSSW